MIMQLIKNPTLFKLQKKSQNGGFAVRKLHTAIASTNIRTSIKIREHAQSIIRPKTEKSIAGLPFRNQTGRAKNSITSYGSANEITLYGRTHYFGFLENGTSKMPPHPVLKPAIKQKMNFATIQIEQTITDFYKL